MQIEINYQDKKNLTELEIESENEQKKKKIEVAEKILDLVFQQLRKKFPQLAPAYLVWKRVPVEEKIILETDGVHLFYQPESLIMQYRDRNMPEVMHCLLHITLHGLLNHFVDRKSFYQKKLADGAMDYEVERMLEYLGEENKLECLGEKDEQEQYKNIGAREIYYKDSGRKDSFVKRHRLQIMVDNHEVWNRSDIYHCMIEMPDTCQCMTGMQGKGNTGYAPGDDIAKIWNEQWKIIFGNLRNKEQIDRAIKDMGKGHGFGRGENIEETRASRENKNSYRYILEQFFGCTEGFREQEGTIDRMLYAYGFELYGNVALIEPEEVSEEKKLNTIVIALDTSGSCYGEVLSGFLRETKNVLRDICETAVFEHILLLQCDEGIQKEQWFDNPEDIPEGDIFETKGFGGTDFRPVFERVGKLQKEQNLEIDCLLFFSDGYGIFPEKKTDYTTFFILPDKGCRTPDWVNTIYLSEANLN